MEDISILGESLDFTKLKVPDLKRELKSRGLATAGNKTELLERLLKATKSKSDDNGSAESVDDQVDDLEEDLLNDDDSDHDPDNIVASEEVLKELDEQLDISPTIKRNKRSLDIDSNSDCKPLKKVVLNRKPSITGECSEVIHKEPPSVSTNVTTPEPLENESDKKVVKLINLSAKERLELRAKKFGTPASVEAKKVARLERFGANVSGTSVTTTPTISKATTNLDALKKRAERFGGSVSKAMSNLQQEERLELRKARFGNLPTTCAPEDDKAKQRLERFKTPVISP